MKTITKWLLGGVAVALGYAAVLAPKARFLGDKLRVGDRAVVDVRNSPELSALVPGDTLDVVTVVRDVSPKDTFLGEVAALRTAGGEIPLPAGGTLVGIRSFPRVGVVSATRDGKPVT